MDGFSVILGDFERLGIAFWIILGCFERLFGISGNPFGCCDVPWGSLGDPRGLLGCACTLRADFPDFPANSGKPSGSILSQCFRKGSSLTFKVEIYLANVKSNFEK